MTQAARFLISTSTSSMQIPTKRGPSLVLSSFRDLHIGKDGMVFGLIDVQRDNGRVDDLVSRGYLKVASIGEATCMVESFVSALEHDTHRILSEVPALVSPRISVTKLLEQFGAIDFANGTRVPGVSVESGDDVHPQDDGNPQDKNDENPQDWDTRVVQRWDPASRSYLAVEEGLRGLRDGDRFRMFESDGDPVEHDGHTEFIAVGEAYNRESDGRVTIDTDPAKGPPRDSKGSFVSSASS